MKKIALLALFTLIGCATTHNVKTDRKPAADEPSQIKTAQGRAEGEVAVYIGDAAIQFMTGPQTAFNIKDKNDVNELGKLQGFLNGKLIELGGNPDGSARLRLA